MDQKEGGVPSIAAVDRALDVLLYFGQTPAQSLGVTEIAAQLGMPKAAVYRILTSLRGRELVAFEPATRRYMLGPASLMIGTAFLAKRDIRLLAAPELAALSASTAETATLSIRNGDIRIYLDQVLPDREVRMEVTIGSSHPLHAGASSKAFLAFMTTAEVSAYLDRHGLTAVTAKTITDKGRLQRDLAAVRKRGYATSVDERQLGAASVAAPIFDHDGKSVAVISVCGPSERLKAHLNSCASALIEATGRLSARIGYPAKS